jgi:SSS family solute:Na+ symporter
MSLSTLDISIIALYAVFIIGLAQWVSREKPGHQKNPQDYFLASKSLPWWAIGASLIAANISAEQIIGMSGSGYALGLAIASYEWMSAITLIIVGKYFLPIFLEQRIYTMPQYLEKRYDHTVRMVMAVFWLVLYVIVNLTAILWLGALAINTMTNIELSAAMIILGSLATAYSLYGGLKAVALTDIVQVVLLVFGGLLIAYLTLNQVGNNNGALTGFVVLTQELPERFDMILSKASPLQGLARYFCAGMWDVDYESILLGFQPIYYSTCPSR